MKLYGNLLYYDGSITRHNCNAAHHLSPIMLILLGQHGQVAREVMNIAAQQGIPLQAFSSQVADFRDSNRVVGILNAAPAGSLVLNAAAYTQVDQAESDPETARQVNAVTPGIIARTCRDRGFKLIHLSTDYVFSGVQAAPYREDDPTGPLGVYGQTKLAGEQAIQVEQPQSLILRTSWVFSAHGKNFVKTMLRLGAQYSEISVVADQTGGPTAAASIARTCLELVQRIDNASESFNYWGVYHYSGAPSTTWHHFAEEIFRQVQLNVRVRAIPTSDYPTPARRPPNSVLNCEKLATVLGIPQPDWKRDLAAVLQQLQVSG